MAAAFCCSDDNFIFFINLVSEGSDSSEPLTLVVPFGGTGWRLCPNRDYVFAFQKEHLVDVAVQKIRLAFFVRLELHQKIVRADIDGCEPADVPVLPNFQRGNHIGGLGFKAFQNCRWNPVRYAFGKASCNEDENQHPHLTTSFLGQSCKRTLKTEIEVSDCVLVRHQSAHCGRGVILRLPPSGKSTLPRPAIVFYVLPVFFQQVVLRVKNSKIIRLYLPFQM